MLYYLDQVPERTTQTYMQFKIHHQPPSVRLTQAHPN